jgi:hypothetical protein
MVVYVEAGVVKADYFDSEGHVIRYVVDGRPGEAAFVSEIRAAEPRYRLTYTQASPGTLNGRFDVAPPGKPEGLDRTCPGRHASSNRSRGDVHDSAGTCNSLSRVMMKRVLGSLAVVWSYVMLVTPVSGTITPSQGVAVDPLQPLAFLIGRWEGSSEGQPGRANVQREYTRILNSRFIRVQNQSVYPPQDNNPKGETHEDVGVFSFDKSRGRAIFRQFHVEGYVNQYVADADSQPGKVVFTTEAIENIPAGYRARETYIVLGPDEFDEVFELAEPGKPLELYSRAHLKRVR